MRNSEIIRKTGETDIVLKLNIDGSGNSKIDTGCGFLDHMLTLFARHGRFDLDVVCRGDVSVDYHHSAEDIGICLGRAFAQARGEGRGIVRYGDIILPMDEALIMAAVDVSGRSYLAFESCGLSEKVGDFDTELVREFFEAFVRESKITLHIKQLSGVNTHHILEGMFKAFARVLRKALTIDSQFANEVPSTKGVIV